jgi:hypothetical protein
MTDAPDLSRWRHDMKNQLGIILGFSDLLLNELDPASPHRSDVSEIHTACQNALDLMAKMPGAGERHEKDSQ